MAISNFGRNNIVLVLLPSLLQVNSPFKNLDYYQHIRSFFQQTRRIDLSLSTSTPDELEKGHAETIDITLHQAHFTLGVLWINTTVRPAYLGAKKAEAKEAGFLENTLLFILVHEDGHPEIANTTLKVLAQQYLMGLDVPMDYPGIMQTGNPSRSSNGFLLPGGPIKWKLHRWPSPLRNEDKLLTSMKEYTSTYSFSSVNEQKPRTGTRFQCEGMFSNFTSAWNHLISKGERLAILFTATLEPSA
ncbi:hypothetical protein NL676_017002 [Syzygium grande]|nr:hypothetical protein NL676_017002 [Syzygium grande]